MKKEMMTAKFATANETNMVGIFTEDCLRDMAKKEPDRFTYNEKEKTLYVLIEKSATSKAIDNYRKKIS